MKWIQACALTAITTAAAGTAIAGSAAAAHTRAQNGLIAFMRPGTERGIWVVRPDGTGLRALTATPEDREDYNPVWAPDGSHVVFERRVLTGPGDDLYTVSPQGTGLRRLTNCGGTADCWSDNEARYSADGNRLAFVRATGPRSGNGPQLIAIYTVSARGAAAHRITTPPKGFEDHYPAWSNDGKNILFQRDTSTDPAGPTVLMRVDITTRTETVVYKLPRWAPGAGIATYSPSGDRILFGLWCIYDDGCGRAGHAPRNAHLATITPDGKNLKILPLKALGDSGAWSPDGRKIVYRCRIARSANSFLCTSNLDGSGLKRFPWPLQSVHPNWGTHV